ncbi:hypothetical protein CIG75_14430 [Tumebacillus algifaecis]|uniref:Uncharacterized protein n=1 Tax=Tumebacillus algifaecis TaxID=1214604 RepID=A0A223D305_9BACL|nr:spore germination protein [Tumebacillus algifaecis]ASS76038.1 hypothetical protein CIG75_14430 [Tumebacillus algifaecis]
MSFTINIFNIKVHNIENASAMNVGQNLLSDFKNNSKHNMGYGQLIGDGNTQKELRAKLDDRDKIDAPSRDTTITKLPSLLR